VENAAEKLREALKSNSSEQIRAAVESLNAAWNEASTKMYESATAEGAGAGPGAGPGGGQQAQSGPAGGSEPGGKKVEDATYEVVDDKDKKGN
jgi:molecular chaperone DnaK